MSRLAIAMAILVSATLHAQSLSFSRGEYVRAVPADPARPAATTMLLTVVAVPGDQLAIAESTLYVNGSPVTQFSGDFLSRVASAPERLPSRLPEGHYFVMAEQQSGGNTSMYWGQHSGVSLQPLQ